MANVRQRVMPHQIDVHSDKNRLHHYWVLPALTGIAAGGAVLGGPWLLPAILLAVLGVSVYAAPRPALFFFIYAASIPLENILVLQGWSGVTLTRYLGIAAGLMLVLHIARTGRINSPPPAIYAWIGFFVWAALSITWSIDFELTSQSVLNHLRFFVLYAAIVLFPFSKNDAEWIKKAVIISGVIAATVIVYQFLNDVTYRETVRASINFGDRLTDPNLLAASLLLPFGLLLSDYLAKRDFISTFRIVALLIFPTGIVLTGSRGGLLGLLVVATLLLSFHLGRNARERVRVVALLALGFTGVALMWPLLPSALTQRFVFTEMIAGGGGGRLDIWRTGLVAWAESPILGHGFSSFLAVSSLEGGWAAVAHNIYLQMLVELGPLGLILLLTALALSFGRHWSTAYALGANAGLMGLLLASFFVDTISRDFFWLALAVVAIAAAPETNTAREAHCLSEHSRERGSNC